jgi:hypothetical protein
MKVFAENPRQMKVKCCNVALTQCVDAVPLEAATCGYASVDIAKVECQSLRNDECCSRLFPASNLALILGLSIGGAVLLLMIVSISYFFYRKARRDQNSQPHSFKVLNEPKEGNPFSNRNLTPSAPVKSPYQTNEPPPVPALRDSILQRKETSDTVKNETPNYDVLTDYGISAITNSPAEPSSDLNEKAPRISRIPKQDSFSANLEVSFANLVAAVPSVNPSNLTTAMELQGTKVVAIHPYEATLDDELSLVPGQPFVMLKSFDDGWALGLMDGKQGAFPLVCVEQLDKNGMLPENSGDIPPTPQEVVIHQEHKIARRLSSMILNDLAKSGTRSKVPFSTYIQELENMK